MGLFGKRPDPADRERVEERVRSGGAPNDRIGAINELVERWRNDDDARRLLRDRVTDDADRDVRTHALLQLAAQRDETAEALTLYRAAVDQASGDADPYSVVAGLDGLYFAGSAGDLARVERWRDSTNDLVADAANGAFDRLYGDA